MRQPWRLVNHDDEIYTAAGTCTLAVITRRAESCSLRLASTRSQMRENMCACVRACAGLGLVRKNVTDEASPLSGYSPRYRWM